MQTKAVLFDLDGTLLPMDQDVFVKAYFKGIAKRLSAHGYEPEKLIEAIWLGTGAMIKNDADISVYPNGDFGELIKFLNSL